jgi:hypothetical protein
MNSTLAPPSGVAVATHQAVAPHASIPFRKTSIVSGSEVFGMLIATCLVLAAFAALAWFARRHGWLDRWTGGAVADRDAKRSLVVQEVLRISRRTTLYRISNGTREFLLAESSAPIVLAPVQVDLGPFS